jgi:hypothetical protein
MTKLDEIINGISEAISVATEGDIDDLLAQSGLVSAPDGGGA